MSSDQTASPANVLAYIHILEAENARLRAKLQQVKTSMGVHVRMCDGQRYLIIEDYAKTTRRVIGVGSLHVRVMYGNHEGSVWAPNDSSLTGAYVDLLVDHMSPPPDSREWILEVIQFRLCHSASEDTYDAVITFDSDNDGYVELTAHPPGPYPHVPNDDTPFRPRTEAHRETTSVSHEYAYRILTEFLACGASMHVETFYYHFP